ncbi:hypothetical protein [Noviherbaspirillum humi]|uniref:hypothetical protein n=1 Tax=Noviherbaspirillum humi TaxID=1688639 RepID=UPI001160C446|nr:hypothetical protein [Noviherbaspirillum humi]
MTGTEVDAATIEHNVGCSGEGTQTGECGDAAWAAGLEAERLNQAAALLEAGASADPVRPFPTLAGEALKARDVKDAGDFQPLN